MGAPWILRAPPPPLFWKVLQEAENQPSLGGMRSPAVAALSLTGGHAFGRACWGALLEAMELHPELRNFLFALLTDSAPHALTQLTPEAVFTLRRTARRLLAPLMGPLGTEVKKH